MLQGWQRWMRLIAAAGVRGQVPDPIVSCDLRELKRPVASSAVQAAAARNAQGFFGVIRIDPPVGGFAAGDVVLELPAAGSWLLATAVVVQAVDRSFAPGIWKLFIEWSHPANFTTTKAYRLSFQPRDNLTGGGDTVATRSRSFRGGDAAPSVLLYGLTTLTGQHSLDLPELYFSEEWKMVVSAEVAMTDPETLTFSVCAQPVLLLDGISAQ